MKLRRLPTLLAFLAGLALSAAPLTGATPRADASTSARASRALAAQVPSRAGASGDSLRAFLVTFGPGAAVWERFGHNALWIHDPEAGPDQAYHYGLFDMSEEGFLLHFLQGRMWYSMGDAPAEWMVDAYRRLGRTATVQALNLSESQIREMQGFLEWNMEPANRVYRYDYFRDNCSTRIRDALDRVLDGRLRERLDDRASPVTYREQAIALTAEDQLLTTGMDLGLGPLADRPITRWELAFIPMRLRDELRDFTLDQDGTTVPLVASERTFPPIGPADERLAEAPLEGRPARRALAHLLAGLLIGSLLAMAGRAATREPRRPRRAAVGRWGLAIGGALWGVLTGLLGLVLLALWTLTDHEFAWRNENLLQANPLALTLAVLVPVAVVGGRWRRAAAVVAMLLAGFSVLGLLIHPLPITPQANLAVISLMLPIHLGLAWAVYRVGRSEIA